MSEIDRKRIEIAEICRVEGHSAVSVTIDDGKVTEVKLEVFEGTRFFERIVLNHHFDEIPHITSRICAICSTGHVLAAIFSLEKIFGFTPSRKTNLLRELMHLGMIIESHATHICALALPDFLGTPDLLSFATTHPEAFAIWGALRSLGAKVQTVVGGRPFHPVNLHVGRFAHEPDAAELMPLLHMLSNNMDIAIKLCEILLALKLPFEKTYQSSFLSLISEDSHYSYFGRNVISSEGWQASVNDYKQYMDERVVGYSHAKHSTVSGKPFMVGSLARLHFFSERLGPAAGRLYGKSPLSAGQQNTVLNNLAQAIELVEAIERAQAVINQLLNYPQEPHESFVAPVPTAGQATGAVECPRGTLYHYYQLSEQGAVMAADMITPSAQNAARIEHDIRVVAEEYHGQQPSQMLEKNLETLVRAYDPCNTCATHMVRVQYANID